MTQTKLKTNRIIFLLVLISTTFAYLVAFTTPTSEIQPEGEEPIIFDNSTKSVVLSKGQSVQLSCYASGIPQPRIYWYRVNYALLSSGGTIDRGHVLNVTNATIADRGVYYCIADNGIGEVARRKIKVEIEFAPIVSVPHSQVFQAVGHNVDLECHVEAFPPPSTITWTKDGVLSTSSVYFFSSRANEQLVSILRVYKLDETQFGNYTCKASNSLDSGSAIVELQESELPVNNNQV